MNATRRFLPFLVLAGFVGLGAWLVSGPAVASNDPFLQLAGGNGGEVVPSWTARQLEKFEAEKRTETSVYLAAVQLVELERARGNVSLAVPTLKDIATRAASQQLRNGVNRLLHDVALELGDSNEARRHLEVIIEESLAQR